MNKIINDTETGIDFQEILNANDLAIVHQSVNNIEQIELEDALKKISTVIDSNQTITVTDFFKRLNYSIPESKENNFIVLTTKKYISTTKLIEVANELNIRPATESELLQYISKNIILHNKKYLCSLVETNVGSRLRVPCSNWDEENLILSGGRHEVGWFSGGGLLFVKK